MFAQLLGPKGLVFRLKPLKLHAAKLAKAIRSLLQERGRLLGCTVFLS